MGQRQNNATGASNHSGRQRIKVCRSLHTTPARATTGGHHILESSISDGTAAPVIQYGKLASADPAGKFPTGNRSQPEKHVIATARRGSINQNRAMAASPKAANIVPVIEASVLNLL